MPGGRDSRSPANDDTPRQRAARSGWAQRPPLAVSMGDPAGIGPDVALLAWTQRIARQLPPFVVVGDLAALRARAAALSLDVPLRQASSVAEAAREMHARDALPVVAIATAVSVTPGQPTSANAAAVIGAIERATQAVVAGEASAIVTCPIAKSVLKQAGFAHPGHTEFLGELGQRLLPGRGRPPVMMLASDALRVVPLTVHIPLAQVPRAITPAMIIETVGTTAAAMVSDFGIANPRIAVAGLNPHAGEDGMLGREEIDVIAPTIATLRGRGLDVSGPHSADTLFHAAARQRYDAVIAMYHDQALIPLKTLAFDSGVNVTLGLPFVRTSPDHGTAFDIAGTGQASPESFIQALLLADSMAARRRLASQGA